jgi:MerR family transcriptional regulator, copper efflux regulator
MQRLGAPLNISSPRDLGTYLKVGDAAALLGVSPWTLRHWDRAGKLKSLRHPVNGYRLYRREDLEALLVRAAGGDPRQETMK